MATGTERIFVQIPSYRDTECQWTIKDLFEKARHPERIFVGVCWQFVPEEDQDCFKVVTRPEQVRTVEYHAKASRGVGWARHQAQLLWQGEEYALQTDAHMRFVPEWDVLLMEKLYTCPTERSLLTAFVPDAPAPASEAPLPVLSVVPKQFCKDGLLELTHCAALTGQSSQAFICPRFLFGPSGFTTSVPADPHLDRYEGLSRAVRLWTHGWNLFLPDKAPAWRPSTNDSARSIRQSHKGKTKQHELSVARIRSILGDRAVSDPSTTIELERYGLGQARTLADYENFCGVDFASRTISDNARRGVFVVAPPASTPAPAVADRNADLHKPVKIFSAGATVVFDDALPHDTWDALYRWAASTDYRAVVPDTQSDTGWQPTAGIVLCSPQATFRQGSAGIRGDAPGSLATALGGLLNRSPTLLGSASEPWQTLTLMAATCPPGSGLSYRTAPAHRGALLYHLTPNWAPDWGGQLLASAAAETGPSGAPSAWAVGRYIPARANRLILLGRDGSWRLAPPAPGIGRIPFMIVLGLIQ